MKSLQQHLNESLLLESYEPKFKPKEWETVLAMFKPRYSNYSQLANLEDAIDDDEVESWIESMIEGGVKDTPENRDILNDIFAWVADNYERDLYDWADSADYIIKHVKKLEPGEWAVSAENYALFMCPKKKLTGNDKKYGVVIANAGDSGAVAEIASTYED
jgi:hypothetical protein